jgi:hypothetical protein
VKEAILMEVHESLSLLFVSRREAVSVGLVVLEFRIDEVVDLENAKCMSENMHRGTCKLDTHIPL